MSELNIPCLLHRGFWLYKKVEACEQVPGEIEEAITILLNVYEKAREEGLYLEKESKESLFFSDLTSFNVKLLCVPFLIGYLYGQIQFPTDRMKRFNTLKSSKQYILQYLQICERYELTKDIPVLKNAFKQYVEEGTTFSSRISLVEKRTHESKIEKKIRDIVKINKERNTLVNSKIKEKEDVVREDGDMFDDYSYPDENELRTLYCSQLQIFIFQSFTELQFIDSEMEGLKDRINLLEQGIDLQKEDMQRILKQFNVQQESGNSSGNYPYTFPAPNVGAGGANGMTVGGVPLQGPVLVRPDGSIVPVNLRGEKKAVNNSTSSSSSSSSSSSVSSSIPSSVLLSLSTAVTQKREDLKKSVFTTEPRYTIPLEEEQKREAAKVMDRLDREKQREREEQSNPAPDEDTDVGSEVKRKKQVAWDDWKDENPTGAGNRK